MISLKSDSVKIENLDYELLVRLPLIDCLYCLYSTDNDCIITSGNDSKHMEGSLHFENRAIDIRFWNIPSEKRPQFVIMLRRALDELFDVVLESDHIHIEYDPGFMKKVS